MAKPSMQEKVSEMLKEAQMATKKRAATTATSAAPVKEVAEERTFDIENNTFFKIIFDPALSSEEKRDAVAKALSYDLEKSRDQNEQTLKEFDLFKEYLQYERQKMAQKIIELSDTDAFSQMHEMFEEINGAAAEFDHSLQPLTEIIDAVYKLRMQGSEMTLDVFKEIQADKEAEIKRAQDIQDAQAALQALQGTIDDHDRSIAALREKKAIFGISLFGLGSITAEAKAQIVNEEIEKAKAITEKEALQGKIQELQTAPANETNFAEWQHEKEKLRELLDISSDEHRERQKRLVAAAQSFVETTDSGLTDVLAHFGKMGDQINTLGEANQGIQVIYAIVTDASTTALKSSKQTHAKLTEAPKEESALARMERENKKIVVEDFIANMDGSASDTVKTYADLTEQGSRINTMKNANREQVAKARDLQSSGVAGVAEGLSSVLTIVSSAALHESAEMASNTIEVMNNRTDEKNLQESLRQAVGIRDRTSQLEKAIDSLAAYRDTAAAVTETTRESLAYVKEAEGRLSGLIKEAQDTIKKTGAVYAEGDGPAEAAPAAEIPAVTRPKKRPSLGDLAPK